jgi:uncharacterized membrane protein YgcG
VTALLAVALAGGLTLVRPHQLWAQGTTTGKVYVAVLTGAQETPAVDTTAFGIARFVLGPDMKMTYEVHFTPLKANFTAAHIHRARAGAAGDVIYPLAAPAADKAGVLAGTLDFQQADVADLDNQGLYINVHSEAFPPGEIRGQIVQVPPGITFTLAAAGSTGGTGGTGTGAQGGTGSTGGTSSTGGGAGGGGGYP